MNIEHVSNKRRFEKRVSKKLNIFSKGRCLASV